MNKLFESVLIESLLAEPTSSYDETISEYDDLTVDEDFAVTLCIGGGEASDERLRLPFKKGESLASGLHRLLGILNHNREYDYMMVDGDDIQSTRPLKNFAELMHFIRRHRVCC